MFDALHKLSDHELRDLAGLLRQLDSERQPPLHAIQQIAGAELGTLVSRKLVELAAAGWRPEQLAAVAEAIATPRMQQDSGISECDLVLSGPEAAGVPTRDTAAVMHALLAEARHEVLLVGYVFHKAQSLFRPLAERLATDERLQVWACVDISRKRTDTSLSSEIVKRFTQNFWTQHWPWTPRPALYYDPRSLETGEAGRSSLHAKCIVIDRESALVLCQSWIDG